jgi:ribose/xylose/arabinose/galactoside ABC-type transport system permease subunit
MTSPSIASETAATSAGFEWLRRRTPELLMEWGIFAALATLIFYFAITAPNFMTVKNWQAVGNSVAVIGILVAPFTIALVAGQVDLTVGIMIGFLSTIFTLVVVRSDHSLVVGMLVMVLAALAVGVINGALVVNFGVNSIVATFAMLQVVFGASYTLWKLHRTNAESSGAFTASLSPGDRGYSLVRMANGDLFGIPYPVLILAGVTVVCYLLLSRSKLGWHIYATGGNRSAALRSGIRVDGITRLVFLLTPIGALLAALITIGRTSQPDPGTGYGYEFDVLTAALLGGIGFEGGLGKVERSIAGALFVVVLKDGMTLRNVDSSYQYMAEAVALILAVVLAAIGAKRRRR